MAEEQTPKATETTEQDSEGLAALGFSVDDELPLTGDGEAEVAEEESDREADPQMVVADEAVREQGATQEAEEATSEEATEESNYEAFQRLLREQAGAEGEGSESSQVDPRDAELREAREREREALMARINDLEAAREAARSQQQAEATEPDDEDRYLSAAMKALQKVGLDDSEEAQALVGTFAELLKINEERIEEARIKPLQAKLDDFQQARQSAQQTATYKQEVIKGLEALALAGDTEKRLVGEFVTVLEQNPDDKSYAFRNTPLGRAFLNDWDGKEWPPPYFRSRAGIEMSGRALASAIDRTVEAYRSESGATAPAQEALSEAPADPPKRRPARPSSNKPDSEDKEREFAEETYGDADAFSDAHPWFKNLDQAFGG